MGVGPEYLVGSGHFAVGFIVGYLLMQVVFKLNSSSLKAQLYAPFIPIVLGVWAALPYFWQASDGQYPLWLNLFVFYPWFHHQDWVIAYLGRPNWVVVVCGVLYGLILLRYIRLVKYCRSYGWPDQVLENKNQKNKNQENHDA